MAYRLNFHNNLNLFLLCLHFFFYEMDKYNFCLFLILFHFRRYLNHLKFSLLLFHFEFIDFQNLSPRFDSIYQIKYFDFEESCFHFSFK